MHGIVWLEEQPTVSIDPATELVRIRYQSDDAQFCRLASIPYMERHAANVLRVIAEWRNADRDNVAPFVHRAALERHG